MASRQQPLRGEQQRGCDPDRQYVDCHQFRSRQLRGSNQSDYRRRLQLGQRRNLQPDLRHQSAEHQSQPWSLTDHGGPTLTHALLPGSPAIDRIPSGANGCGTDVTSDQRGIARPQGLGCDIGAYEVAVVVDTQPPAVSAVTAAPNPTPANAPVTLTATVDDRTTGNSHIVSAEYNVDGGSWTPMNAADGAFDSPLESVIATLTFASSQVGTRTLCVCGADVFSNTSSEACTTVTVALADTTPPVITPTVSGALGNNGWYTSNVTISWTVIDDESPITTQDGCDSTTVTTDTTGATFTCTATSEGGTASESVTIRRDATPPTITGSASPASNVHGWRNRLVTVDFTCTDETSGIAACAAPLVLGEGANQSATGTATDNAGNTASTQVTDLNIDLTAPEVTVTGVADGAIYTIGLVPEAGCATTDALSGVQTDAILSVTGGDANGLGIFTAQCAGATDHADNPGAASVTYEVTSAPPPPPPASFTFNTFSVDRLNVNQRFKVLFFMSNFTLEPGSDGIDPATEPVALALANLTTTIPAGAFRRGRLGAYTYFGTIDNISLQALIVPLSGNRFRFQVAGYGVELSGITNPVTVELMIGNDRGTTSATANIR